MEVERSVGISDCYPRALLTTYLCLTAGLPCTITVGILARQRTCTLGALPLGRFPASPSPSIGSTNHWWSSKSGVESGAEGGDPTQRARLVDRMSSRVTSFANAPLRLDIRLGVGARHVAADGCTVSYLSIFDDEIEARLDEFIGFEVPTIWTSRASGECSLRLEPTDAVVVGCRNGRVLVARGGAANFPLYWTVKAGTSWSVRCSLLIGIACCPTTGLITSPSQWSHWVDRTSPISQRARHCCVGFAAAGAVSRLSARIRL